MKTKFRTGLKEDAQWRSWNVLLVCEASVPARGPVLKVTRATLGWTSQSSSDLMIVHHLCLQASFCRLLSLPQLSFLGPFIPSGFIILRCSRAPSGVISSSFSHLCIDNSHISISNSGFGTNCLVSFSTYVAIRHSPFTSPEHYFWFQLTSLFCSQHMKYMPVSVYSTNVHLVALGQWNLAGTTFSPVTSNHLSFSSSPESLSPAAAYWWV